MKKIPFTKILLFLAIIFHSYTVAAQEKDTVLLRINKIPNDTNKIIALCKISSHLGIQDVNNENIFKYQKIASDLAEKINNPKFYVRVNILRAAVLKKRGAYDSANALLKRLIVISYKNKLNKFLASAYLDLANINTRTTQYRQALPYADSCLKYNKIAKNEVGIHQAYYTKSRIYTYLSKPDSAIYSLDFALDNAIKRKDTADIADCYSMMGNIYLEDMQYVKSLRNSHAALKYALQINDTYGLGILYGNIGAVYDRWKMADSMIYYDLLAVEMCKKSGDISGEGIILNNLGVGYLLKKDFQKASVAFKRSEEISRELSDTSALALNYLNIGNVFMEQKRYAESAEYFHKALFISEKKDILNIRLSSYKGLTDLEQRKGNYKLALEYQQKLSSLTDSLLSEERTEKIGELDAKYNNTRLQYEKTVTEKEKLILQNEKLAATQQRNYIISASVLFLILIVFSLYFYTQRRKRLEEKNRTVTILASEEKERTRIARELHDGLGQILLTAKLNASALEDSVQGDDVPILQNMLQLIDRSVTEVRSISHNLMPQILIEKGLMEAIDDMVYQINYSKVLDVTFDHRNFSLKLPKSNEIAIYRVIQEVLNNMLKHANANKINILLSSENNRLKLVITDNGKGFDTSVLEKSGGIGWKNILARLSLINGKLNLDSEPGKGTTVNIDVAV